MLIATFISIKIQYVLLIKKAIPKITEISIIPPVFFGLKAL